MKQQVQERLDDDGLINSEPDYLPASIAMGIDETLTAVEAPTERSNTKLAYVLEAIGSK